jgi:CRISPR type I-E-associated protein CasB/Cse2
MIGTRSDPVKIICDWWERLQEDRGAAARLRRAETLLAAAMEPAALKLARILGVRPEELPDVALIAAVLADLRENRSSEKIARTLGTPEDRPLCSSLRLRRLLEAAPGEAQLTAFRRVTALLRHSGNVADLAASLLDWNNPFRRDQRRQKWLYDYYHTDNPAQGQLRETT